MADALDSKSSVRKDVWVRLPPLVLSVGTRRENCGVFSMHAVLEKLLEKRLRNYKTVCQRLIN